MNKPSQQPILVDPFIIRLIAEEFVALGAIAALVNTGELKPYLKKSDAYAQFGRYRVDQWIAKGRLSIRKDGNQSASWRIDRMEIEVLAAAAKLLDYIP